MKPRIVIPTVAPEAYQALMNLENYIATTSLTKTHKELIKIRASQINGCAFCINMHTADARKHGETEQRIYLISAWREADVYTEEEKAILALTEEVTLISNHVSEETYQNAAKLFDEKYLAEIILAIITINSWNRFAITTGLRAV
ncbi:carboxymuconolactone decarboxylase family protein [Flavobacterium sp. GA093]|uniref:Carboxymuconolactone decarboxylase family protein n=1 Tax=Flavobacterium hydrocarbonoxydans TaxID=2683249 RepID=A0A6I4NR10_9FLAO|nr:carboxymuconolactone decarboxylase family protein [Flavobacterium hydrocarbonoxydans]MWB96856.1 carboxymuconolactone decarboxylase family protein [Flavobacterium hydrocarbonoxydans]